MANEVAPSGSAVGHSATEQFFAQHAKERAVNIHRKKCGYRGCAKVWSFGMAGSKAAAEFCAQSAKERKVSDLE